MRHVQTVLERAEIDAQNAEAVFREQDCVVAACRLSCFALLLGERHTTNKKAAHAHAQVAFKIWS